VGLAKPGNEFVGFDPATRGFRRLFLDPVRGTLQTPEDIKRAEPQPICRRTGGAHGAAPAPTVTASKG
jgi:hypothetical protein